MFVKYGGLDDGLDKRFRRIGQDWPVFAFAKALNIRNDSQNVLFAIGHVRDPGISYRRSVLSQTESLSLLYMQTYGSLEKLVSWLCLGALGCF